MCRRALHKNMKISLNPDYHERKAARAVKLQHTICTNNKFPNVKPLIKEPINQIYIHHDVIVSFG